MEDGPSRTTRHIRNALAGILDALLPPRCLSCGTEVAGVGALCPACWGGMTFLGAPLCACCGLPFEFAAPDAGLCGACAAAAPAYDRCRSVLAYDDASRPLLLAFKHGDRTDTAVGLGAWLARVGTELLEEADLLVPVPLHRWRLFARRYNQAALLAQAVGRASGVAVAEDLLERRRRTSSQGGLSRKGRARNVAGAFALRPRWKERVAGARIVLVDDVFTTGATVSECTRTLRRAGAATVDVLTLARVVKSVAL